MEVAIRFSPFSTPEDPRFLIADVTGRTFKLGRITGQNSRGDWQWKELARNNRVPAFRAFDWTPRHNAVAVGQWSGETTVLGISSEVSSSTEDVGSLSLPVKSQRQCNAIAFNTDTLLATGLEKIRNDFCLQVYDVAHWLERRGGSIGTSLRSTHATEPIRRLASSEGIVSLKFFPDNPHMLVAGVKASCIRLYDLREPAGSSSGGGGAALQYPTPSVHNLAIDPADPNYFASASPVRDAAVNIWDRRAPQRSVSGAVSDAAVIKMQNVFYGDRSSETVNIWSLKYSPAESGCLGVLGSGGNFRVFHTKKEYIEPVQSSSNKSRRSVVPANLYLDWSETIGNGKQQKTKTTSQSQGNDGRILAFDFTNLLTTGQGQCAITLRGNQQVGIHNLCRSPPVLATSTLHNIITSRAAIDQSTNLEGLNHWSPPGELNLSKDLKARCQVSLIPLITGKSAIKQQLAAQSDPSTIDDGWNDTPIDATKVKQVDPPVSASKPCIEDVLTFADASRRRCIEGYGLDAEKNLAIVAEDPSLQDLWLWTARATKNAAEGQMATENADFSYLGLFHLWNGTLGSRGETRKRGSHSAINMVTELQALAAQLELWDVNFPKTTRLAQRKLCLHACGFETNPDQMIEQVKPLALAGRSVEGAFRALIGDDWQLAITALRSGPRNQQNRALGAVVALYGDSEHPDRIQRSADELLGDDRSPLTQAIVAYLTRTSPLPSVAVQLPTHYRAALAIKLAPDHELTAFIAERTQTAIREGDITHVLFTGLSGDALPLFSRFVDHTHDVQSAVLALAPVAPRFLRSERLTQWRLAYRAQLNAWRLFIARAAFDVQATQLSRGEDGNPILQPAARQMTLRCTNCDHALHREAPSSQPTGPPGPGGKATPSSSFSGVLGGTNGPANAKDGTRCPRCGAGLPRCVVCDHRTGVVDPMTRGGAEADRRRGERRDPLDEFVEVCLRCRHVYHRGHAAAWFGKHPVCAAIECECTCNALDGIAKFVEANVATAEVSR